MGHIDVMSQWVDINSCETGNPDLGEKEEIKEPVASRFCSVRQEEGGKTSCFGPPVWSQC